MLTRLITGLLLLVLTLVSAPASVPAQTGDGSIAAATLLFTKYVNLERGYWPAVGDLYADEDVIQNRRRYPSGEVRELSLTAYRARRRARTSASPRPASPSSSATPASRCWWGGAPTGAG